MKKITSILLCSYLFINCDSNTAEIRNFEKNVEISKEFFKAFSDEKLDEMKSFVTEDFTWSPPPTGIDSLDINTWYNAMKGFNAEFNEIKFTKQLYFAGLDDNQKPNGDVRVYGTWESLNSITNKPVLMDYCAVFSFNAEGKIYHQREWYNTADLEQNSLVDLAIIIPLTKGYSKWYKGFIKDNKNRKRFCDDSRTLVFQDTKNPNKVSVYLYDVDMSKIGEMMADPAFEKFAISLGEDLANKKIYTLNSL